MLCSEARARIRSAVAESGTGVSLQDVFAEARSLLTGGVQPVEYILFMSEVHTIAQRLIEEFRQQEIAA